ncbi:MAG: peptide-methionine (S)-S-oxide reductase [Verrucomicrobia bacterium RIFCSPHIGHO2_12_FULL_41_10]|nr:MAG: peptide-methionine (S)-S-oxide reductase [Verrucomicrobia bacterium RIFCSPHIGHO2_12_FULL_41_10]
MIRKTDSLSPPLLAVIRDKATEHPFTGQYDSWDKPGTYLCRQCGLALFRAHAKFHSGCGWPSFDAEIPTAVVRKPDPDGHRTEILCARCQAHLGHVFEGERHTVKNMRHCVNSASLDFVDSPIVTDSEEAIFAAGCFWGVEYYFKQLPGVLKTEVGYSGGHTDHPSYESVCNGDTGHFEVIRVLYDPQETSYQNVVKYFFEIHDPTQTNGQGPDLGEQYLSVVFYYDSARKVQTEALIATLKKQGLKVATRVLPVSIFWSAETYHQDYYAKTGKMPYCHQHVKRLWS